VVVQIVQKCHCASDPKSPRKVERERERERKTERERERERKRKRKQERERERMKGGGREETWKNVM